MRRSYFWWTEKIENQTLRANVQELLEDCGEVASFSRRKAEAEPSDYEGARQSLRSTMQEIQAQPDTEIEGKKHNPLWDAMMTIRPAMLSARVPKRFIYVFSQELWILAQQARKNAQLQKAEFLEQLQKQMAERPVCGWRTLISGGVVVERRKVGDSIINVLHGFPIRIPVNIARETGLKLTTKIENIQAHKAALSKMQESGMVSEKVSAALQVLADDIYEHIKR